MERPDQPEPDSTQTLIRQALEELRVSVGPFNLPNDSLQSFVEARLVGATRALHVDDLVFTHAVLQGLPEALRVFRGRVRSACSVVTRIDGASHFLEEVAQALSVRLVSEKPPKLEQYRGEATLDAFLRAAAVRTALNLKRRSALEDTAEPDELSEFAVIAEDADLALARAHHRADFQAAFQVALSRLTSHERNVLRLHLLAGQTIDELAAVYSVNRSSAARWLTHIRAKLLKATRQAIAERLRLGDDELSSFMRLAASGLDLSLKRLLHDAG